MGREVEGRFKSEGTCYTYDWFMVMYGRNQCNTVEQLSSN